LVIFACKLLFIKGCFELCNVDFDEFSLVSLPTSVVLRYCQGVSKNLQIDIIHCFVDQFKLNVDYLTMLLKLSPSIILFIGLLINLHHIRYFCGPNLNGSFL
jgi:hypothetical protein